MKLGANAPGCFNDMDMMTVGMEGKGGNSALFEGGETFGTEGTYRIQFCIWCMFQTPLIMGCDVRSVSDKYRDLLCNRELIAINQDIECRPAFPVSFDHNLVFCKLLSDGGFALLFVNGDEQEKTLSCITHDIGYTVGSGYKIHMRDILSGEEMVQGDFPEIKVPGRDCRIFKCRLVKD
jgi:alpha-galactosidase